MADRNFRSPFYHLLSHPAVSLPPLNPQSSQLRAARHLQVPQTGWSLVQEEASLLKSDGSSSNLLTHQPLDTLALAALTRL